MDHTKNKQTLDSLVNPLPLFSAAVLFAWSKNLSILDIFFIIWQVFTTHVLYQKWGAMTWVKCIIWQETENQFVLFLCEYVTRRDYEASMSRSIGPRHDMDGHIQMLPPTCCKNILYSTQGHFLCPVYFVVQLWELEDTPRVRPVCRLLRNFGQVWIK